VIGKNQQSTTHTFSMRRPPSDASRPAGEPPFGAWRRRRVIVACCGPGLAASLADAMIDLHRFLLLLDDGCSPGLAARILAPLDTPDPQR